MSHQRGILSVVIPPKAKATNHPKKKLKRISVLIIFGEINL